MKGKAFFEENVILVLRENRSVTKKNAFTQPNEMFVMPCKYKHLPLLEILAKRVY